jgi:diadenosine tetraphosphate (Ap4A) HIT family hydrolase
MTDDRHRNLRHLPFGEAVEPRNDLRSWEIFPFEIEEPLRLRVLEEPTAADPPRSGAEGPADCRSCAKPDETYIWTDENWRLTALTEPSACPVVVLLESRLHADFDELPPALAAGLGPVMQRVERAIMDLGGIGRVHMNRWGDGATHFHWWFLARPLGVGQMRGLFMPMWDNMLPLTDVETWRANLVSVAAAMAAQGGTAHVGAQ